MSDSYNCLGFQDLRVFQRRKGGEGFDIEVVTDFLCFGPGFMKSPGQIAAWSFPSNLPQPKHGSGGPVGTNLEIPATNNAEIDELA